MNIFSYLFRLVLFMGLVCISCNAEDDTWRMWKEKGEGLLLKSLSYEALERDASWTQKQEGKFAAFYKGQRVDLNSLWYVFVVSGAQKEIYGFHVPSSIPDHGTAVEIKGGSIIKLKETVNGLSKGQVVFYEKGKPRAVVNVVDGFMIGEYVRWDAAGNVEERRTFTTPTEYPQDWSPRSP